MGLAILFAFLAGLITAVSPCVLPVLPIVLAGGVGESRRRPFAIIAGLATCFLVSILFAAWILDKLGLPKDLLRNISIGLLFLLALTLLVPQVGVWIERPLARLSRRPSGDLGGGFVLGCALGFVFVPCGGPAIGFVTSAAASSDFGGKTLAIAVSYTVGLSIVLLAIALGGRRASTAIRTGAGRLRVASGVVLAAAALALVFNLDTRLQTWLPDWTHFLQKQTEASGSGKKAFQRGTNVTERKQAARAPAAVGSLPDYGPAPNFTGISDWFNSKPLTIAGLRGKVVLVDFWTYSCINCLRTLPHVEAWNRMYRKDGLVIVGVHTPEFAFEAVPSNVRGAIKRLGVKYPVALDPKYGTWTAWGNQYWPAKYLIDRQGHVRYAHFGEGNYNVTEENIRLLLGEKMASPASDRLRDLTPAGSLTPESYLGSNRLDRYAGSPLHHGLGDYTFPSKLGQDELAYSGRLKLEPQRIVAVRDARLRLHFQASKVYLVLGGTGTVQVLVNGKPERTVRVNADRLYTLVDRADPQDALLELRFSPGVEAYAFTFG